MSHHVNPGPNATFLSTQTQQIADVGQAQAITLNTTVVAKGISVVDNTKITFRQKGDYYVAYSAIGHATSGSNKDLSIFLKYNGNPVTASTTTISCTSGNPQVNAASFVLPVAADGDYYEFWMAGETANIEILATAAGGTPSIPACPSIIVSVFQCA